MENNKESKKKTKHRSKDPKAIFGDKFIHRLLKGIKLKSYDKRV